MKRRLKTLDGLSKDVQSEYEKKGDWFVLKVEADEDDDGDDDRKVDEFRRNNIQLKKENEALKKRYENVDVEGYEQARTALEKVRDAEERELLAKGKFDEVMEKRTQRMREAHEKALKKEQDRAIAAEQRAGTFKTDLRNTKIEAAIRRAADKAKVKFLPSATDDVYRRAYSVFDLDDTGKLVALENGEPRLTADRKPYTEESFVLDVLENASHLVESAQGTGISSPGKGGKPVGVMEVSSGDIKGFGHKLEDIASGKVDVRMKT